MHAQIFSTNAFFNRFDNNFKVKKKSTPFDRSTRSTLEILYSTPSVWLLLKKRIESYIIIVYYIFSFLLLITISVLWINSRSELFATPAPCRSRQRRTQINIFLFSRLTTVNEWHLLSTATSYFLQARERQNV